MKKLLLALGLVATSTGVFATGYQVYSQPNANAQVVSQLTDQNQNQYIQFYQQGNWVKVADTSTGQVGWVDTAQAQKAPVQTQYQQAVNALSAQQKQLEAQRQIFEQKYHQASQNIQQQMQQLQQQMNGAATKASQAQKVTSNVQVPPNASAVANTNTAQRSFNAINIQTNSDGKTAIITKEWLGKDGKIHKETKQVLVSDLQKMSPNF